MAVVTRRAGGRRRRGAPAAVQETLFDITVRPERRYYRQMLDALARSGFGGEALAAEVTVSKLFGVVWASEPARDGNAEEAFGLGLVDYARHTRTPTSVALLHAVAVVAPIREVREAAALAADMLTGGGLPSPRWNPPVGAVTPGRCWAYEDVFGDMSTVMCEYGYGPDIRTAPRHAIAVQVDHAMFSVATNVTLVDDPDITIRDLRYEAKNSGAMYALRQVDPAWAAALLGRAFARTDLIEGVDVTHDFPDSRALALARMSALPQAADALAPEPEPSPDQRRALVEEFLRSAEARAVEHAEQVGRLIVEYGCVYDPGNVARVSPAKWEVFLFDWLPARSDQLPAVVRAWSAWAGRRSGLPGMARDELAHVLDEMLDDYLSGV